MTFRRDFSLNSHFNIRNTTSCVTSEMTRVPPPDVFSLGVNRHSLWDMNKDVLSAVGGPDEAVTLWSWKVLTHSLEHWTWVSTHRSANRDRKVLTERRRWPQDSVLLQQGTEERCCIPAPTNQPKRLTLSRCACVWSVMDLADLWAAAALFHLPIRGFSPSGRGRKGREMC